MTPDQTKQKIERFVNKMLTKKCRCKEGTCEGHDLEPDLLRCIAFGLELAKEAVEPCSRICEDATEEGDCSTQTLAAIQELIDATRV